MSSWTLSLTRTTRLRPASLIVRRTVVMSRLYNSTTQRTPSRHKVEHGSSVPGPVETDIGAPESSFIPLFIDVSCRDVFSPVTRFDPSGSLRPTPSDSSFGVDPGRPYRSRRNHRSRLQIPQTTFSVPEVGFQRRDRPTTPDGKRLRSSSRTRYRDR